MVPLPNPDRFYSPPLFVTLVNRGESVAGAGWGAIPRLWYAGENGFWTPGAASETESQKKKASWRGRPGASSVVCFSGRPCLLGHRDGEGLIPHSRKSRRSFSSFLLGLLRRSPSNNVASLVFLKMNAIPRLG